MARFTAKKGGQNIAQKQYGQKGVKVAGDARLRIIAKNRSKVVDARDKLATLAKTMDARQKLQKIRNLKQGKLDVKTTAKGNITIVTKTNGQLQLTTKKKVTAAAAAAKTGKAPQNQQPTTLTAAIAAANRRLANSGNQGNAKAAKLKQQQLQRQHQLQLQQQQQQHAVNHGAVIKKRVAVARNPSPVVLLPELRLTRTIQSEAALLDEELIRTHVDPRVLQRTIRQGVTTRYTTEPVYDQRPPLYTRDRMEEIRSRPPPPSFTTAPPRRFDYDDPRREQEIEDEIFRRRVAQERALAAGSMAMGRTMADHIMDAGTSHVSPLQGTKIVISNLQPSVTQDDIIELFGDVGPIKRAKLSGNGIAEVVYVNKADAVKAVDVYHNRQLDGKPMECQIVGAIPDAYSDSKVAFQRPAGSGGREAPHPEMSAIHKALFLNEPKKMPFLSSNPHFTVVMPPQEVAPATRYRYN